MSRSARRRPASAMDSDEDEQSSPAHNAGDTHTRTSTRKRERAHSAEDLHTNEDESNERIEDTEREPVDQTYSRSVYELEAVRIEATENEMAKLEKLNEAAKERCIKSVCRLFLFKGLQKGVVKRTEVNEVLHEIDAAYKGLTKPVMAHVQCRIHNLTGYVILADNQIKGCEETCKGECYHLFNSIHSPALRKILAERDSAARRENTLRGLMFLVFHVIFNAASSEGVLKNELISQLQSLDGRLTKTAHGKESGEEMMDVTSLLKRMKDEHYISISKPSLKTAGEGQTDDVVGFGPRFFLEVGKRNLMISYFHFIGEPVDEATLPSSD